jgi:hypothetical protein
MIKINLIYDYVTPNGELPNGLNPFYLNSLIKNDFVFDHRALDDFDRKYGAISVWHGEQVVEPVITNKFSVSDIHYGFSTVEDYTHDNNSFYLYTITPFGGASSTYGYEFTYNEGKSFFNFISENAKRLIREIPNVYLFINYSNEGTLDFNWFRIIHSDSKKFNIPLEKIIFCVSDYFIEMNYNIWKQSENIEDGNIKLLYLNWSLNSKARELFQIYNDENTSFNNYSNKCSIVKKEDVNLDKIRDKKFLMLNRRLRPHRIYSICLFNQMNILNQFLISYDINTMQLYEMRPDNIYMHIEDESYISNLITQFYKLKNTNPKQTIDYENLENVWGFNFENKEPYLDSYIHITSETTFFEIGGYFSEKTWKPIGHLQPFIFMGPAYGLEELKKLGFKTFSPFIDESYDLEMDPEKRFKMIMGEIERLSKISIDDIHTWYISIFNDILLYNQKLLFDNSDYIKNKEIVMDKFKQLFYGNT